MNVRRARRALLAWFNKSKRPLPWRQTRDPYPIWVSETMLQQTTVGVVIPYYERFLRRFPNLRSLAAAREDTVLALWSGLGYYSRARNLRLAARELASKHEGIFPRDVETARTLPGVGPYTANAIASIAYGTRVAVVDGNVRRVLSRLFAVRGLTPQKTQALAQSLLSPTSPGAWNEGLMELGATICTPRNPKCDMCPLLPECRGRLRAEYWSGHPSPRPSIRTVVEMALVERRGAILLARNPLKQLMGGLLELPSAGLPGPGKAGRNLRTRYPRIFAIETKATATFAHTVTHHRIEGRLYRARLLGSGLPKAAAFHPVSSLTDLPLGGMTRKALRAVGIALR